MKRKAVDKYTLHCFSAHISGWLLLHFFLVNFNFLICRKEVMTIGTKKHTPLVCARFEDESSTLVQTLEHLDLHQLFIQCLHLIYPVWILWTLIFGVFILIVASCEIFVTCTTYIFCICMGVYMCR